MKPDEPTRDDNQGEGGRRTAYRQGPRPTKVTLDELMTRGRTVADRIESMVRRIADRLRRPG